jgi:hypothetical protein
MQALTWTADFLRSAVCEVLTFILKTVPRYWRTWREYQEEDYPLAQRLRRRNGD